MAITRLRGPGVAPALMSCRRALSASVAATGASPSFHGNSKSASSFSSSRRIIEGAKSTSTALGPRRACSVGFPRRFASTQAAATGDGSASETYTASYAFFEALWEAGITHCFVNLGSDHPSIIEAMVKARRDANGKLPRIITCPNEMVALSMADGYARLTGKAQCVLIHVDVGTQGLGAAVHNAASGRAPVFIFSGMSPFTIEGELRGSRTEFSQWMQDVPDQKAIVAQYCNYAAEVKTGTNIKQMVNRALQFATSDPQGISYLCAAREVMETEIKPYSLKQDHWKPVELGGLPTKAVSDIADALAGAERPLIITGYSGRNKKIPAALVKLADMIKGLRVVDAGGSDMCFPADHPAWGGLRYGADASIPEADAIVVLDCDVPWIQTRCNPSPDAKIYHIDVDPLKELMPVHYFQSDGRFRADALTAVEQVTAELSTNSQSAAAKKLSSRDQSAADKARSDAYNARLEEISKAAVPLEDGSFGTGYLTKTLRGLVPDDTIWAIEAVTNTGFVHDNVRPTHPGSWINCGGGGLGWSGGGALGIKVATDFEAGGNNKGKFVVQIVGDGTYLFSVPGSVYWIAKRYNIPILTIVLNNKGWHAPRRSLLLVHPDGLGSKATNEEINISFDPVPDYAGIAAAAGGGDVHALKVEKTADLESVLKDAVAKVKAGKTTVVDCKVAPDC